MSQAQLRAALDRILAQARLTSVVDQLASIAAERATEVEPIDPQLAAQWDVACGKLAVAANHIRL